MAKVRLHRREAESGSLPLVCMQCGAPATMVNPVRFSWQSSATRVDTGMTGLVGASVGSAITKQMTVNMPLCMDHRNQHPSWTGSGIKAAEITDDTITLTNVSEPFARALERHAAAASPFAGPHGSSPGNRTVQRESPPRASDQYGRPPQPAQQEWDQLADSFTADPSSQPLPVGPPPSKSGSGWLWILLGGLVLLPLLLCGGVVTMMLVMPRANGPGQAPAANFGPAMQPQGPFGVPGFQDHFLQQQQDFDKQMRQNQDWIRKQQEEAQRRHEEFMKQIEQEQERHLQRVDP